MLHKTDDYPATVHNYEYILHDRTRMLSNYAFLNQFLDCSFVVRKGGIRNSFADDVFKMTAINTWSMSWFSAIPLRLS
jgi:hypothetical protein